MKQGPPTQSHACEGGVIIDHWAQLSQAELEHLLHAASIPFVLCVPIGHVNVVTVADRPRTREWIQQLKDRINSGAWVGAVGEVPDGGGLFTFSVVTSYQL